MRIQTYACNQCKIQKKETNAWWVADFDRGDNQEVTGVTLTKWDAAGELDDADAHLCGITCVSEWLSRNLLS